MDKRIMDMTYVICFYWQGDRWQQEGYVEEKGHINLQQRFMDQAGLVDDALPARYVNNLFRGVKRFTKSPFKFVCFTNENLEGLDKEIETRPFEVVTKQGVLPRLYMFSQEAGLFGHQVLCLDLDVVIVGDLQDFIEYRGTFCARSKFKQGEAFKLDGDIMSFKAGKETEGRFWNPFIEDIERAEELTKGRERYWVRMVAGEIAERWENIAPRRILSFKRHMRKESIIPERASIISCHGIPRPHEIKNNWIKEFWK